MINSRYDGILHKETSPRTMEGFFCFIRYFAKAFVAFCLVKSIRKKSIKLSNSTYVGILLFNVDVSLKYYVIENE